MKNICFYFEVHQALRLKRYRFFDIGDNHYYYDDFQTEDYLRNLVEEAYLPANRTIAEMIRSSNGKFKCAFSISGISLDLFEQYAPELIDSFRELAQSNAVEFLAEPYAHSLASVFNPQEFELQVKMHSDKIESLFGKRPTAFRNAELIYSDEIGELVANMGYKVMLIDEARHIMGWKSPNFVYRHAYRPKLKLLVRNYKLSDDIAFRFSDHSWKDFPLTAEKYIHWIKNTPPEENIINIWMGYEAIGHFQRQESGIFDFLKAIPYRAMEQEIGFIFPSEAGRRIEAVDSLSVPHPISWSGHEKDLTPWLGNDLQQEALNKLYAVSERVHLCKEHPLKYDWLMLQTSDHFRYMSHKDPFGTYYESAYDAFINYMNVLADFLDRVNAQYPDGIENEELNELIKTINNQEMQIALLEQEIAKLQAAKPVCKRKTN